MKSRAAFLVAAVILLTALGYLRDPPWLSNVTSGLSAWETDEAGVPYRWTRGHASFFVPADRRAVVLTMRSDKDAPTDWPITATLTIDDRPAEIITFRDEGWHDVRLRLPPRGNRDVRRIDVKLDRVRSRQRGIQLREPRVE
ncbi:MAG TPA: hypothetical protein VJ813_11610 [Vicinamibacterales bacterium]|nr:hypothetical protein [Vicinamibacterales bacterium]